MNGDRTAWNGADVMEMTVLAEEEKLDFTAGGTHEATQKGEIHDASPRKRSCSTKPIGTITTSFNVGKVLR